MKFTIIRRIYFSSPQAGFYSKVVARPFESDIPPQIGYQYEDSAWYRNDHPKVESVVINIKSGKCVVELEPIAVDCIEIVNRVVNKILQHEGWQDWESA